MVNGYIAIGAISHKTEHNAKTACFYFGFTPGGTPKIGGASVCVRVGVGVGAVHGVGSGFLVGADTSAGGFGQANKRNFSRTGAIRTVGFNFSQKAVYS